MEKLEQTMQIYHAIYMGCLAVTLLLLAITIILAVRWRIWEAVGILSGKVAAKAISDVKGKQKKNKKKSENREKTASAEVTTEKLWYREAQTNPPIQSATVLLQQEQNATVLLQQQEQNATVLLQQTPEGTVLLDSSNQQNFGKTEYLQESEPVQKGVWQMQILDEIIEIHSQERI